MKKLFTTTPATQNLTSFSAFAKVQLKKSALKNVKGGDDIIVEDEITG